MSINFSLVPTIFESQESTTIVVPKDFLPQFKELCQRAGNLWPDASPEMKAFIDIITEGKIQQDYSFIHHGSRSTIPAEFSANLLNYRNQLENPNDN